MTAAVGRRARRHLAVMAGLGLLVAATFGGAGRDPATSLGAASSWTGGIDLYRSGSFSTQQSWLWCTAADVQIIRNIARREHDHSAATQRRFFDYMRAHNRYDIPVSDGVDPAGWTAGLRHYVDGRYRLVTSGSFDAALRSAVTNLRLTHLPVGITVAHGNHAWVLTGFSATADPAATGRFTVTSVRVSGPLWGLQSRTYGYDMRPDTKLTPKQLRGFFTPWHYAGVRMSWEGRWVSIQPIPASAAPKPPTPAPSLRPSPAPASPAPSASESTAIAGSASSGAPPNEVARVEPGTATPSAPAADPGSSASALREVGAPLLIVLAGLTVLALAATAARRRRA